MVVGTCKFILYIPSCHSLKEKRGIIRRIKDRTFNAFKIAVAEVGSQDVWQRAEIGIAAVGNDRRLIESIIGKVDSFIEGLGLAEIVDAHTEIMNL